MYYSIQSCLVEEKSIIYIKKNSLAAFIKKMQKKIYILLNN